MDDVEKMWKDRIAKLPLRDKGSIKELDPQMVNSNVTSIKASQFKLELSF